ncbi:MAG: 5-bromo-4-chloroindolyl phosphate hydrolysis family protein [Pseudomonadota bacterium]
MRSPKSALTLAMAGGLLSVVLIAWLLRFHAWLPLIGGGAVTIGLLFALWPKAQAPRKRHLPDGVTPELYEEVIARLSAAVDCLETYARAAPPADAELFRHMARVIDRIRGHHVANPAHAVSTRPFIRHTLGRMLSQMADYIDLVRRAGPEGDDRLAEISRGFEAFVPALEKIDRACLENDLTELEINVEVLNEQLDRRGRS